MALDYAWRTFFSNVREAVASDQPPLKGLEELYAATIDKLHSNRATQEDIVERISRVREAQA